MDAHNNFHAVAGIVVGLNTAAVSRLKHTFGDLPKKYRQIVTRLTEFLNPEGSYSAYRAILQTKILPVIPYMYVHLGNWPWEFIFIL